MEAPDRTQALLTLGQIASDGHDYERAAKCFEEATVLNPQISAPIFGLANALAKLGREAEAKIQLERSRVLEEQQERLQDIRRALLVDTANTRLRVEAAEILEAQNDHATAANWMLSALRYDPDLRAAHELLAEFFEREGKKELARQHRKAAQHVN
jgi:Tfp pilus assembly protein PilF